MLVTKKYNGAGVSVHFPKSKAGQFQEPRAEKIIPGFLIQKRHDLFFPLILLPKIKEIVGPFTVFSQMTRTLGILSHLFSLKDKVIRTSTFRVESMKVYVAVARTE